MLRKIFILLPILSLCLISLYSQDNKTFVTGNSNSSQLYKGDLKRIDEYSGEALDAMHLSRSIVMNVLNLPLKETSYMLQRVINNEIKYEYMDNGLLKEIKGMNSEGLELWSYIYQYNDIGQLVKETSLDSQRQIEWSASYLYNEKLLLVEKQTLNTEGIVNLQDSFQYDEKDLLLVRTTHYGDGKLLKRVQFSYFDNGNIKLEENFDAGGLYESRAFSYLQNDLLSEISVYASDGTLRKKTTSIYDSSGLLISERLYVPDREDSQESFYIYDNQGNRIREKTFGGEYTLREMTYR